MSTERVLWIVTGACLVCAAAAFALLTSDRAPVSPGSTVTLRDAPQIAAPRTPATWAADPVAAAIPAVVRPDHIVQREKRMRALMISSPPRYYTMTLRELRALARNGDDDAMMQLAEQFAHEDGRLRADPDYPAGENARALARQYLTDALLSGRIRAAALLSRQLFDENQVGEAYVWRLVSSKLGDGTNPVWGEDTNQFASLSDAEKTAAEARAGALVNTLLENKQRAYQQRQSSPQ